MRIQTLIFTALLFILPTIAVGAATNCPTTSDNLEDECKKTLGCYFASGAVSTCNKCAVGTYKESSFTECKPCTNKPDAVQYMKNDAYAGMQADICPWKLKCTTGQAANNDNRSCKECQSHQYQNQEFYIVYNKNGYQDKIPDTVYTYHTISQNDNVGAQLSSAPKCENKQMNIQLNKPCNTTGCTLSDASLSNEETHVYTCQSNDNNLQLILNNGYYTLVGYSTNNAKKVNANYQCTDDPDCYTLNDICTNKTNGTSIYAIWKPETYTIYYYFDNTVIQTVNADFSTQQSITDTNIKNTIRTWSKFDIYEVDDQKKETISSQQTKIGDTIPHPEKAGNNIYIKILCPAGYYCKNNKYNANNMTLCPDGKTSAPGSTKVDNCTNDAYTTFCDLNGCMTFE